MIEPRCCIALKYRCMEGIKLDANFQSDPFIESKHLPHDNTRSKVAPQINSNILQYWLTVDPDSMSIYEMTITMDDYELGALLQLIDRMSQESLSHEFGLISDRVILKHFLVRRSGRSSATILGSSPGTGSHQVRCT